MEESGKEYNMCDIKKNPKLLEEARELGSISNHVAK